MNVPQALEHANAFFFPELVYGSGFQAMDSERQKNEEAMATLREEFAKNDNPAFGYDIIRDLADRNRDLCDQMGIERLNNTRDSSLARGMSDDDLCGQVAALQRRKKATVIREVHGDRNNLGVAYVTKPIKGTVLGIDIETTDRYPDRGYIINVGFELMDLTPDAEPYDPEVHFCGIPGMYRERGVPLERIHHITWADLDGQTPFRENKALQAKILKLMKKYPYMAHNAAFEDSWFTLNLDGYAEARKAGATSAVSSTPRSRRCRASPARRRSRTGRAAAARCRRARTRCTRASTTPISCSRPCRPSSTRATASRWRSLDTRSTRQKCHTQSEDRR